MIDFEHYEIESASTHIVAPGQAHQIFREAGASGHVLIFSETFCLEQDDAWSSLPVVNLFPLKRAVISFDRYKKPGRTPLIEMVLPGLLN